MKTLILYYSYASHTKTIAEALAAKENADITEIKGEKRLGKLKAYSLGCLAALGGKPWPIQPLDTDLSAYDRFVLLAPVWAGNPPPFVNSLWELLPEGKTIAMKMVSASGQSRCEQKMEAQLQARGCVLESFEDIKAKRSRAHSAL